jgi:hypothetical protein
MIRLGIRKHLLVVFRTEQKYDALTAVFNRGDRPVLLVKLANSAKHIARELAEIYLGNGKFSRFPAGSARTTSCDDSRRNCRRFIWARGLIRFDVSAGLTYGGHYKLEAAERGDSRATAGIGSAGRECQHS